MEAIEIKDHLLIASIISLSLLLISIIFLVIRYNNIKRKSIWIGLITFFGLYLLIVGGALIDDVNIQKELAMLDLNNDGLFSKEEQTKEQIEVFNRLINSTGRNFSVVTGFIFAGILSFVVFLISLGTIKYLKLREEEGE